MAQVVKNYDPKIRIATISPDGKTATVSVDWVDSVTKQMYSRTPLTITGGKILVGTKQIGSADPTLTANVAQVAAALVALANSAINAGTVTP